MNLIKLLSIVLVGVLILLFNGCSSDSNNKLKNGSKIILSKQDELFLDSLQYAAFLYFLEEINPDNGLVKDRTASWSASSIAAVGFAIPSYAVGAERKWITRNEAAQKVKTILNFFFNSEQSKSKTATGYKGFYYHFLNMKNGKRDYNSELSTIDTGILLSGIIFARQYFNQDNQTESAIRSIADKLIERLDWNFFIMETNDEYNNSICMGWKPESGFHHMGWVGYNEAILLYILAAGGNLNNSIDAYHAWTSGYKWREPYANLAHVIFPPMFGHQYSHIFIDFRGIVDEYMQKKGIDYFENSRRATLTQQRYAIENPLNWLGYDSLTWGITASDGPGEKYSSSDKKFYSYAARGTSGKDSVLFDDGTLAPTAVAGSIVFAPELCLPTLKNIHQKYSSKGLWGKYGMLDAFNPSLNWYNSDYLGIDQGPIVLMIENFRTAMIWKYFMSDPIVQRGLKILGFKKLNSKGTK